MRLGFPLKKTIFPVCRMLSCNISEAVTAMLNITLEAKLQWSYLEVCFWDSVKSTQSKCAVCKPHQDYNLIS